MSHVQADCSLQAEDEFIQLEDLLSSLNDFLATKTAAAAPSAEPGPRSPWQDLIQQPALQDASAPRVAAPHVAAAAPAMATKQREMEEEPEAADQGEQGWEVLDGAGSFGGLDIQFLKNMQSGLESLGYNLTSSDIMQQLSADETLPAALLPLFQSAGGEPLVLIEQVRQWQQAIREQIEQEKELAKKRQRPVWRCAVCGRYGCPVAPYIESYQEY